MHLSINGGTLAVTENIENATCTINVDSQVHIREADVQEFIDDLNAALKKFEF